MPESVLKAALYVRVSTQDQSCELQKRELLQYASARGFTVVTVYEDKATGTNGDRAQLKQMLSDAKARKFDVLIAWKLDRVFRSLKGMVATLQELGDLGIQFISLKEQIDLTTASGRLMTHIIAAFAEFEAAIIKERVRAGLANAKARGKKLGRPAQIDWVVVQQLHQAGLSLSEIGKRVGATKSAVSKVLSKLRLKNSLNKTEPMALTTSGSGNRETLV